MEHKKPNLFPRTIFLKDFENNGVEAQDSANDQELCSVESNISQNGNILANQYELVRNILRNLPMKDLLNCCKVSKLWRDIGVLVRKENCKYNSKSFFWSAAPADVSFYSQYPLFMSPHHKKVEKCLQDETNKYILLFLDVF